MSTRRARIKAVTSLPPRRKNAAAAENKVKDTPEKEKSSKSPRATLDENKSPRNKNVDTVNFENIAEKIIISENPPISNVTSVDSASKEITPIVLRTPEKVRSIENKKNASNVFASPASKDSPKKTFASPLAPSPKISKNTDLPRPPTPQNRPTPTSHKLNDNNELQIAERIVSKIDHNVKSSKDTTKFDYNIPSVTESTDDEAMDGIVPLKPAASVPKPLEVLKNAIISENAEVLFDPIVPLPSPSKVRPKLRPVPRLGPHRRNSVQGSASESEDENRRGVLNSRDVHTLQALPNRDVSRVRNDSVCSSVGQAASQPAPASPARDKIQISKARRQEECRRRMASRRRREHTKRDALTMYDLIFYNPTSNPLVLTEDEIKLKEAKEKHEAESKKEAPKKPPESPKKSEAAPVPQIKLGPKGEIVLDEQSLVIKQTESDRKVSSVVHEGAWGPGAEYKKHNLTRSAGWTAPETVRFYRALAALGTDFTLMAQLFPDRTRKHLKVKFKKEEKLNGAQIDKALRASLQFDVAQLKQEFEEERALAARQAELERERLAKLKLAERNRMKAAREVRLRCSRGSKALEAEKVPPVHENAVNTEEILKIHSIRKRAHRNSAPQTTPQASKIAIPRAASKPKEESPNTRTNTLLQVKTPETINTLKLPRNIETGSLVVLTVNDPSSPAKKMLQTYIANSPGQLTPVALPSNLLNYVVGYMKKGTLNASSPILSPNSVASVESNSASSVTLLPSPNKRQRHSSFTITQL